MWGGSKASSVLVYHWILHLNGAWTQQIPETCNQLPALLFSRFTLTPMRSGWGCLLVEMKGTREKNF